MGAPVADSFPKSVRVGFRTYTIERWAHREASATGRWGETCNGTACIRVADVLITGEPLKAANTLLHEVLHACWYVGALEAEDSQERVVTVFANQLSQVWADNPELAAYLHATMGQR